MFDLNGVARILRSWVRDKRDHIMGYRNATNRSVLTGTMAARPSGVADSLNDARNASMSPVGTSGVGKHCFSTCRYSSDTG